MSRWMRWGLACVAWCAAVLAQAADFPARPLTMVVGFAQGGSTDTQARVLAKVMSEKLGQPVTVLNVPGAGGGAAAAMVASSTEGGYVFQFGVSSSFALTPLIMSTSFNLDSFAYVASVSRNQLAFVTGERTGIRDWRSMMQALKRHPGQVYATQATQDRLIIQHIAQKEGLELRIVPTTGGAGSVPMVLSGEAWLAFSGGSHTDYTDSGRMVVLASLDERRLMGYPDAPTLKELGYGVSVESLRVVAVPANTPQSHIDALAAALEAATRDPRFIDVTVNRIRQPIQFMRGEEVKAVVRREAEEFKRLQDALKTR